MAHTSIATPSSRLGSALRFSLLLLITGVTALTTQAQIALRMESAPAGAYLAGTNIGGAVSADGNTFVYSTSSATTNYVWNASTGSTLVRFDPSSSSELVTGISGDGSTVIGRARTGPSGSRLFTPYAWSNGTATALATPTVINAATNQTQSVSHDGSQVGLQFESQYYVWNAGILGSPTDRVRGFSTDGTTYITATHYNRNASPVAFPSVSSLAPENGHAWTNVDLRALSANGNVVVGSVFNDVSDYNDPNFRSQAVRWTEAGGYELLGYIPGFRETDALSVSADGSIVIGMYGPSDFVNYTFYPFIWDMVTGMRPLGDALSAAGLDTTGWEFQTGAIAANGTTIVGTGLFNGNPMLFQVTDYAPVSAVPEPATWTALAGLTSLGFVCWRRRSNNNGRKEF